MSEVIESHAFTWYYYPVWCEGVVPIIGQYIDVPSQRTNLAGDVLTNS